MVVWRLLFFWESLIFGGYVSFREGRSQNEPGIIGKNDPIRLKLDLKKGTLPPKKKLHFYQESMEENLFVCWNSLMKGSTSTSVSPNHLAFVGGNGWHVGTAQ